MCRFPVKRTCLLCGSEELLLGEDWEGEISIAWKLTEIRKYYSTIFRIAEVLL
jgi:hypothetical protein